MTSDDDVDSMLVDLKEEPLERILDPEPRTSAGGFFLGGLGAGGGGSADDGSVGSDCRSGRRLRSTADRRACVRELRP